MTNVNVVTKMPFASTGRPRPRNTAERLAGDASSGPEGPEPALVCDRHRHAVHGRHRARLDRVSDDVEVAVLGVRELAELREEDQLEERRAEHRRHVDRRVDPVEEAAVGEVPADEEGPRASVSCERQRRPGARDVLEQPESQRADREAREPEQRDHPERPPHLAAEGGRAGSRAPQ